jgi:hypothetical protein
MLRSVGHLIGGSSRGNITDYGARNENIKKCIQNK